MTTRAWKQLVRRQIESNKRTGRAPSTVKELARMLKADPAGLYRMLDGDQPTSKYAPRICEILGVQPAMVANPAVVDAASEDEWDRMLDAVRRLPADRQRHALAVMRTFVKQLDEE